MAGAPEDGTAFRTARPPRHHLEETVDALEERVLGERADQSRDEDQDESPAIEQDLDPEDMGSGAGSEPSG